nr:PAS domain-containing sensor histidine kinase [uncultured Carboxylicivirga sp.]
MAKLNTENSKHHKLEVLSKLNISSIFENTTDSIWAINADYKILYVNKVFADAFYTSFGIKLKIGSNLLLSLPEPIRKIWKSRYDRALNNESFSFIDQVNTDNVSLYIEVFMNPILIEEKTVGALFFGKDITNRKLDEVALKNSQLLLRASLENQKDTILFSISKNYEYLYFNSAHQKVMKYAYDKEIKIGANILECISNEEDRIVAKENYDRALRGESHSNIRIFGNENKAYYESFFNPIKNEKNEIIGATGLARDISERKKSELALQKSEKELKELNSTKDKLFSIISHDLRGPFSSIIGLSELLIENLNDTTFTDFEKYLRVINNSANNTLILLDNLLNWAKSQTGTLNFNPEKMILSEVVTEVINLYKPIARAKKIALNYFNLEEIDVFADKNILETVLRNLISNAIKFTDYEGDIWIYASRKDNWVEITVSDNGVGITKEKQKELFKLSTDSSTNGTKNKEGSGLGLILCKDFIEIQKGKLWVESREGKGSAFKFTIPRNELY